MAKIKVLIASGISQEVADILQDAPPEMEINFLPEGTAAQRSPFRCRNPLRNGVRIGTPLCEIPSVGHAAFCRRGRFNVSCL